jgi:NAD+ diphosphatase
VKDAESVTFAGGTLDRAAHLRGDAAVQAALAAAAGARCLALWCGKPLLDLAEGPRLAWLGMDSPVFAAGPTPTIFLGLEAGAPRFAREVPDWQPPPAEAGPRPFVDQERESHPSLPDRFRFGDLRATMAELPAADAGNAAAAKGIFGWHATHGFCARCGAASEPADAGWRRSCPACGGQHFPRTDPVVIMLILHGNAVLLGRSPGWPPGMYSLLAGFMEPGESIEAAVRREACEEAGVPIGAVGYLSSQPWPFPSSLMIGCRAEALSRAIERDPAELEDARWVSREGVLAALTGQDPDLRPARRGSIARFLIERWLADRLG